jgi:Asp/Glu/hydantoin racemase
MKRFLGRGMIRIWHQSVTELSLDSAYSRCLARLAEQRLAGTAEVSLHGLAKGTYLGKPASVSLGNAFIYHRALDGVIDQALQAQKEGYDAFVIGSYSEPMMAEIRSILDIPVASVLEATLFVGCSYGDRLGLITTSEDVRAMIGKAVKVHGIGARVADIRAIQPAFEGPALHGCFDAPEAILAAFESAADASIESGADVLVPAEGVIAALLADKGIARYRQAPVLDVLGITWRYAAMQVELARSGGLTMTRRGRYSSADPELAALYGQPRDRRT